MTGARHFLTVADTVGSGIPNAPGDLVTSRKLTAIATYDLRDDDVKGYVELDRAGSTLRLLLQRMGEDGAAAGALGLYATGPLLSGAQEHRSDGGATERFCERRTRCSGSTGGGRRKVGSRGFCLRGLHHLNQELGDIEAPSGMTRNPSLRQSLRRYGASIFRDAGTSGPLPSDSQSACSGASRIVLWGARLYLPDKWTESPRTHEGSRSSPTV